MANPLRVTKTYKYIERKEKEKKEIRYRDTSYLPFRYREIHKGTLTLMDVMKQTAGTLWDGET